MCECLEFVEEGEEVFEGVYGVEKIEEGKVKIESCWGV